MLLKELEERNLITIGRGKIISKYDMEKFPGIFPVYSSSALKNGEIGKYGKYMFDDERITWSIDGGGKLFYRKPHKYSVTNVGGWIKINNETILLAKYLYYSLYYQWENNFFDYTFKAHPSVIREKYDVILRSIKEQEEIILILDRINLVIEKTKELLILFDELIKSRFIEMFKDKGHPIIPLKELSTSKAEYGAGSASVPYEEGRPRYVRITDINDDGTLNEDIVCSVNTQDDIDYKLSYGDFMFARMGATVGKTYAFFEGKEIYAGYLIRYKLDLKKLNPRYLFTYTKSEEYLLWIKNNQSGAAQPGINAKKYDALPIPVAPIELQNKFADFVKQIDKLKFITKKQIDLLNELLEKKMDEYFNV